MSKSVVIVGGGLVGLSSALFLTEAGAEVTVIDSGALGSGAARGNAGFMCTAIVEPLPAPGAIGNALRSLRDPHAALRILPRAVPKMTPWLLAFARNCTASRYESGRAALARFNRNSGEVVERLVHQGAAVTMSRELLVPYHDVAKSRAPLQGTATDGRVRRPNPGPRGRRRRDPPPGACCHRARSRRTDHARRPRHRSSAVRRLGHRHPQVAKRAHHGTHDGREGHVVGRSSSVTRSQRRNECRWRGVRAHRGRGYRACSPSSSICAWR